MPFALLLCSLNLSAQEWNHSFGATIAVLTGKIEEAGAKSNFAMSQTLITWFPRYNLTEGTNSSLSVGMLPALGFGIARNTYDSDAGISFAYDIPVVIDYNFGAKSFRDNENTFGGYAGLGFGYHKVQISKSRHSDYNGASYGPLARLGARFTSSSESWAGHGLTVGLYYKMGIEKDKLKAFGFNVLFDL